MQIDLLEFASTWLAITVTTVFGMTLRRHEQNYMNMIVHVSENCNHIEIVEMNNLTKLTQNVCVFQCVQKLNLSNAGEMRKASKYK